MSFYSISKGREQMPRASRLSTPYGTEIYMTLEAPESGNTEDALRALFSRYSACIQENGADEGSEIFLRLHVSDISNQASKVDAFLRERGVVSFSSVVGQPPASGSKIALEAYHIISDKAEKEKPSDDILHVAHGPYRSSWIRSLPRSAVSAQGQTREIFQDLSDKLSCLGARLKDDVIRTWIYIHDIDENYRSFADARRDVFSSLGMTGDAHTIASTGIGGLSRGGGHIVYMDSLSMTGLEDGQVAYMSAPGHMCPTHKYNVTFERGVRITFGDRTHYHISGTASIDKEGNVLYPGDVERQAERALENINALLDCHSSSLRDLKMMRIYLRDHGDFECISSFLNDNLPAGLPYVLVQGAVCRPEWLIEMDGVAVSYSADERFEPFCR
jgi:enamine deaminase RidA (YjgF/YER057c/UK114 family)